MPFLESHWLMLAGVDWMQVTLVVSKHSFVCTSANLEHFYGIVSIILDRKKYKTA